ncbi:MAG: IS66 family transposase [Gemmatimonadaceae bacterium]
MPTVPGPDRGRGRAGAVPEDLPEASPVVRRVDVAVGRCRRCGRRVQGRHPLQTSDALGAAAVQLGPHALALLVVLNKQLGLSHGKIATLLRERFRWPVTSGAITRALHRVARQAAPTYAALCARVRGSPMVAPDETSWKVGGRLQWLWAFATPETTVYAIQPGRGYRPAAAVLGHDYAGVLVRDGWAPYRRCQAAGHQPCLAHLLRRARDLRVAHPHARLPQRIHASLQRALALRDRRDHLSAHGLSVARGRLVAEFLRALDRPGSAPALQRFAAHLRTETPAIMSFLFDATLDATNWRAEQALRPAVVNRKVSGGNRTARGAETQQILTSVVRTATQRHLRPTDVLIDLLQAPTPTIAPALE